MTDAILLVPEFVAASLMGEAPHRSLPTLTLGNPLRNQNYSRWRSGEVAYRIGSSSSASLAMRAPALSSRLISLVFFQSPRP